MSRSGWCALGLLAVSLWAGSAQAEVWTAQTVTTSVRLEAELLRSLGFEIAGAGSGQATFRSVAPSRLEFRAPAGDFERFDAGTLIHDGGFSLQGPAGSLHLDPMILTVSEGRDDFDWVDATGRRWFVLRDMQFAANFEAQELRVLNISIHVAPELARRLGHDELAYTYVGLANLVLPALIPPEHGGGVGAGNEVCPETAGPIDVALTGIDIVSQLAREAGVRVALAPNATLENVGTGSVAWFESIAPLQFGLAPPGPHPFLSLAMFRLDADGSLVQLGLGGVKHAFFTVNNICSCAGGQILYAGCSDTYAVSTNALRTYLAPREEVSAFSGAWERVGSHFDQCLSAGCNPVTDDMDDFRDHFDAAEHDAFEHRLVVPEAELSVAGATYFVSAWYLVAGDVNIFNGMGHRAVTPNLVGSLWTFGFADAGLTNGSLLEEIPSDDFVPLDTGEGRVQLSVKTTDLGAAGTHFEYALMNFDFDRKLDRFSVPIPPGALVANADSRGLGDDPANDWTVTIDATSVSWQAPQGLELDWGMLQSFGFDVDADPVPGEIAASVAEAGSPMSLAFQTIVAPEPSPTLLGAIVVLALATLSATTRAVPKR